MVTRFVYSPLKDFAPKATERLLAADRVCGEADWLGHGFKGLRPAFHSQSIADQMETRV
jgi:hypothetical protein